MLSFIYRLVREFEAEHGLRPSVVYLNIDHFHRLRHDFVDPEDIEGIMNCLGMEIVIDKAAVHPHVSNIGLTRHTAAAG
jgi:hypothetical protein